MTENIKYSTKEEITQELKEYIKLSIQHIDCHDSEQIEILLDVGKENICFDFMWDCLSHNTFDLNTSKSSVFYIKHEDFGDKDLVELLKNAKSG